MFPPPLHLGTGRWDKFLTLVHHGKGQRHKVHSSMHHNTRRSDWVPLPCALLLRAKGLCSPPVCTTSQVGGIVCPLSYAAQHEAKRLGSPPVCNLGQGRGNSSPPLSTSAHDGGTSSPPLSAS